MDFEKIKTDFEKRYGKTCEKIYFAGMGTEFFRENAKTLSGCLSLGEAMATAKRDDGRITVQFSGSDDVTSFNVDEMDTLRGKSVVRILKNARDCGVKLGGADIFIFKNSRITDLSEPLILGGIGAFCEKVPRKEAFLPRFENYAENMSILAGKKGCLTIFDGQRTNHIPFFGGMCKIVITHTDGESTAIKKSANASFDDAVLALKRGDAEKFGYLLDKDTEKLLRENKCKGREAIFSASKATKDALGNGVLPVGDIFSVVENHKVDRFIQELSAWCRKYFGGAPDFYVTDFVDSGYFAD